MFPWAFALMQGLKHFFMSHFIYIYMYKLYGYMKMYIVFAKYVCLIGLVLCCFKQ